eukprot:jgi/Mesvir1/11018/Mv21435-RA.1
MKLYTRRGDEGRSRINGPGDLHKSEEIFEALGAVDEANSFLGLARQTCKDAALKDDVIPDIQARLLDVGSALSTPCGDARRDARCRLRMFEDVILTEARAMPPVHPIFIGTGQMAGSTSSVDGDARRPFEHPSNINIYTFRFVHSVSLPGVRVRDLHGFHGDFVYVHGGAGDLDPFRYETSDYAGYYGSKDVPAGVFPPMPETDKTDPKTWGRVDLNQMKDFVVGIPESVQTVTELFQKENPLFLFYFAINAFKNLLAKSKRPVYPGVAGTTSGSDAAIHRLDRIDRAVIM